MGQQERLLLPIAEAHWQVGLGRSKFYEYVASGEIETVKVGRRTLVPQDGLRAFVDRLRGRGTDADPVVISDRRTAR
jgi:excisionase family DNA binding protein